MNTEMFGVPACILNDGNGCKLTVMQTCSDFSFACFQTRNNTIGGITDHNKNPWSKVYEEALGNPDSTIR